MARTVEVLRGMFVLRVVAAPDVPARHAHAQLDPGIARLQAFFTAVGQRRNILYLANMLTLCIHRRLQVTGCSNTDG